MFKVLLLQSWYALSDPALEKQLAGDLLFRRFIGLSITELVPDHSTIWRFRQLLKKKYLIRSLLTAISDQFTEQGLYIKLGEISIIDASVIEVKQCRPNKKKDGSSTQDPEASWNVKVASDNKSKSTYGYKAHLNVDEDGLIKAMDYTAAMFMIKIDLQCYLRVIKRVFMQIVLIKAKSQRMVIEAWHQKLFNQMGVSKHPINKQTNKDKT